MPHPAPGHKSFSDWPRVRRASLARGRAHALAEWKCEVDHRLVPTVFLIGRWDGALSAEPEPAANTSGHRGQELADANAAFAATARRTARRCPAMGLERGWRRTSRSIPVNGIGGWSRARMVQYLRTGSRPVRWRRRWRPPRAHRMPICRPSPEGWRARPGARSCRSGCRVGPRQPFPAASCDNRPKSGAQRSSRIAFSSAPSCPPRLASTVAISER
jgi:hypothetical protein